MSLDHTKRLQILQGLAVGDALGACTEFLPAEEVQERHGTLRGFVPGSPLGFAPGEFTDDTQVTLGALRAYQDAEDSAERLPRLMVAFERWLDSMPPDVGNLTRTAIRELERTGPAGGLRAWAHSGFESAGNGGLMRAAAPVIAGVPAADLDRESVLLAALTHADPRSIISCVVFARTLSAVASGTDPARAWAAALSSAESYPVEDVISEAMGTEWRQDIASRLPAAWQQVGDRVKRGLAGVQGDQSGYVLDTLQAAAWASRATDFATPLLGIASHGNDSDTAGAVAGALLAAQGLTPPVEWLRQVHSRHAWECWDPSWDSTDLARFVPDD